MNKDRKIGVNHLLEFIPDSLLANLSTKTKEPEILFELKNVDVKETLDIATTNDNSCKKADDLLNFLVKDLEWYKWFLENKKQPSITYSLQYLQLTRSITHSLTINETMQVV